MRHLTTFRVTLLSLAIGLIAACLLYKQAWRIPVVQNLRDAQLFFALWIVATPLAALLAAFGRIAKWTSVLTSIALCLGVAAPAYGLTSAVGRVRSASQDKAVLCNLRQLAAAADQYYLENGVHVVKFDDLVGPTQYVKAINSVAGEDYLSSFPLRDGGILSAEFPSGRMINYNTGDTNPPGYKNVYEAGERAPWRASKPAAAASVEVKNTPGAAAPATKGAPALSDEALARVLGKPVHKVRRGTMCASCHAKKS